MAFFHAAFRHSFRDSMGALRVPHWGLPPAPLPAAPIVIMVNHPSWWDGMGPMLIVQSLLDGRHVYTPMDAAAFERYGFMKRLGVFGVDGESARGAVSFLRTAREVLKNPGHLLWIHAAGRFHDVRERPVPLTPGIIRLAEVAPQAIFLPLALEYVFWDEKRPEALAAFGPPIAGEALAAMPRDERATHLRSALESTMDRLAASAITRDALAFKTVIRGKEGMGGIYQLWRRARAALRGERFDARHMAEGGKS
ncbi:lysophospholipid acyltransferase family protein [Plastoroseomonas arctica]|uniref:Glycerol acyltransferase n=1 Tax=Plastoroseomonas arctica TaxID=1509237 RepID=A0AAF1JVX7_9PROT|nr:lysophospholipid acyltransferase family protein [Plastoroseomonas arctica]MBR0654332.1 glycerol acyltransferase [Plastoroseomonas arctica]